MKQIDKTKDKQKHGKQRGKKDAVQLAVALKEQLLPFRVGLALFLLLVIAQIINLAGGRF